MQLKPTCTKKLVQTFEFAILVAEKATDVQKYCGTLEIIGNAEY